jgi:Uncharacterized protein conserved in bacteria (DUF2247)
MTATEYFRSKGIPITWDTLRIGFEGPRSFPPQVETQELNAFADVRLAGGAEATPEVTDLSILSPGDRQAAIDDLRQLAKHDSDGVDVEHRKWRLFLVDTLIESLPHDPIQGLREMTEFWALLEFPADGPHVVQGRGNSISPPDYYTRDMFETMRKRHLAWLEREQDALRRLSDRSRAPRRGAQRRAVRGRS